MKTEVYNHKGEQVGEVTLSKEIFEVPMNADLVHQVVVSQASNERQGSAHTKTRGEVRGGGRKPWRQKGTGRARHGSTRSPIWVGGGVSGGPRNEKVFTRVIPKKMRKRALCMVLSQKAKEGLLVVVDALELPTPKTSAVSSMIKKLPLNSGTRLVLYHEGKNVFLASRNIPKTAVMETRNVNLKDLLNHKYLLISKDGIKVLEKACAL